MRSSVATLWACILLAGVSTAQASDATEASATEFTETAPATATLILDDERDVATEPADKTHAPYAHSAP